jgi:hypothetical protein
MTVKLPANSPAADEPTPAIDELRKILKSVHMAESLFPLERFSKTAMRFPPVT